MYCVFDQKEYLKEWKKKHPNYQTEWRKKNKEHETAYKKKYREENHEKIKEYDRNYQKRRRAQLTKKKKERRDFLLKTNPEIVRARERRARAKLDKKHKAEYDKEYHRKNRVHRRKYHEQWRKSPSGIEHSKAYLERLAKHVNVSANGYMYACMQWSQAVRNMYDNQCQVCFGEAEHSHHQLYKRHYPQLALSLNNGIALCRRCHLEIHGMHDKT